MSRHRMLLVALLAGSLSALGPVATSGAAESVTQSVSAESLQRAARQQANLQMHPQIAAAGERVQSADAARSAMTATFRPRKKGRPVLLQRKQGRRWVKVARARQPRSGRVEFTAPYARKNGNRITYRVAAARFDGLRPVVSRGVSTGVADAAGFRDEFTGSTLNTAVWSHRSQHYDARNRQCSKGDPEAVAVEGGRLALSVDRDEDRLTTRCDPTTDETTTKYAWRINGHVGTAGKYAMTYGYAAARIKFQPRAGQHGAFWMMPEASRPATFGDASSTGAEIDVIEWFGPRRRTGLASFVYHWPQTPDRPTKVGGWIDDPSRFGERWASSYHVFSVEWTPSRYVFRIDGKETFRTSQGVSGQPEFLILSLLSSDYELDNIAESHLPQTMSVDWVRTWER